MSGVRVDSSSLMTGVGRKVLVWRQSSGPATRVWRRGEEQSGSMEQTELEEGYLKQEEELWR